MGVLMHLEQFFPMDSPNCLFFSSPMEPQNSMLLLHDALWVIIIAGFNQFHRTSWFLTVGCGIISNVYISNIIWSWCSSKHYAWMNATGPFWWCIIIISANCQSGPWSMLSYDVTKPQWVKKQTGCSDIIILYDLTVYSALLQKSPYICNGSAMACMLPEFWRQLVL